MHTRTAGLKLSFLSPRAKLEEKRKKEEEKRLREEEKVDCSRRTTAWCVPSAWGSQVALVWTGPCANTFWPVGSTYSLLSCRVARACLGVGGFEELTSKECFQLRNAGAPVLGAMVSLHFFVLIFSSV